MIAHSDLAACVHLHLSPFVGPMSNAFACFCHCLLTKLGEAVDRSGGDYTQYGL